MKESKKIKKKNGENEERNRMKEDKKWSKKEKNEEKLWNNR